MKVIHLALLCTQFLFIFAVDPTQEASTWKIEYNRLWRQVLEVEKKASGITYKFPNLKTLQAEMDRLYGRLDHLTSQDHIVKLVASSDHPDQAFLESEMEYAKKTAEIYKVDQQITKELKKVNDPNHWISASESTKAVVKEWQDFYPVRFKAHVDLAEHTLGYA